MFKILQYRLQQSVNRELPDIQAGFIKGRGARDQIANVHSIIEKGREFQENICFIDYTKAVDCRIKTNWKILRVGNTRPCYLPPEKPVHRSRGNS